LLSVSGTQLATLPGSDELRSKLATITLDMLDDIARLYPDDRRVLFERAQVLRILAHIAQSTGETRAALANFTQAIDLFQSLLTDNALEPEARRWLAYAYMERGEFFHVFGPLQRAEADFRAALTETQRITASDHPVFRSLEPTILTNRSEVYLLLDRKPEALADATQAVKLLGTLIHQPGGKPPEPRDLWIYAIALTDKGIATARSGNPDLGEADIANAISVTERIPPSSPNALDGVYQMAIASCRLARLHENTPSRFPRALAYYDQAVRALEPLVSQFPFDTFYRGELASAFSGRARVAFALGKFQNAEADMTAARSALERVLDKMPDHPERLGSLCEITALRGLDQSRRNQPQEARKSLDKATSLERKLRSLDPVRQIDAPSLKMLEAKLEPR
jgi:tetratricopeptide (TPR) repeat protein